MQLRGHDGDVTAFAVSVRGGGGGAKNGALLPRSNPLGLTAKTALKQPYSPSHTILGGPRNPNNTRNRTAARCSRRRSAASTATASCGTRRRSRRASASRSTTPRSSRSASRATTACWRRSAARRERARASGGGGARCFGWWWRSALCCLLMVARARLVSSAIKYTYPAQPTTTTTATTSPLQQRAARLRARRAHRQDRHRVAPVRAGARRRARVGAGLRPVLRVCHGGGAPGARLDRRPVQGVCQLRARDDGHRAQVSVLRKRGGAGRAAFLRSGGRGSIDWSCMARSRC